MEMGTSDLMLLWGGNLLVRLPVLLALLVGLILALVAYQNRGKRLAYLLGAIGFGALLILSLLGVLASALPYTLLRSTPPGVVGTILVVLNVTLSLFDAGAFVLLIVALLKRDRTGGAP